jgi:hypothetical protein
MEILHEAVVYGFFALGRGRDFSFMIPRREQHAPESMGILEY